MKILYASILILIYSVIVQGQIQSVIGNSGGEYKTTNFQLEFTLGEPIIPTLANNRLVLTQGFHQPDILLSTTTVEIEDVTFDIDVYPSPFLTELNIATLGKDVPK